MPLNVATYLRVSTAEQNLEPQRKELAEYAERRGWNIVAEFTDVTSASNEERPGLGALMAAVAANEFGAVMVVKLDRLARSMAHFADLIKAMEKVEVAFICISQGIDTSKDNPAGRLQMHVLAAVAEFERSLIRERTKSGLAVARAAGKVIGRPSKVLVKNWPEVIAQWEDEAEGYSFADLAKRLGGVSKATAWALVKKWRADQPELTPPMSYLAQV